MVTDLGTADQQFAVPDQDLRWRVTGADYSEDDFRRSGRDSLDDLQRALRYPDLELSGFSRALDFGCGCGRVVRHLSKVSEVVELHGCDTDGAAIAWAQQHLPFARFVHNDALPPLPYADGTFDLVMNHSVFTHLPEDYQDAWLAELRRVAAPGGWVLLTVAGLHAFDGLVQAWREWPADPSGLVATMESRGFLHITDDSWTVSSFPDWYHSSFHSPSYVLRHWAEFFTVVGYFPRGALSFQDAVLLRRDA
jgi:SAM-dependent methyltransferase